MKKQILSLTFLFLSAPIACMESDDNSVVVTYKPPLQKYPDGMGFIPEENLLADCEPLPDDARERVGALLEKYPAIKQLCSLQQQHRWILQQENPNLPNSLSSHNYVFATTEDQDGEVVKIAGFQNTLKSAISTEGADPYNRDRANAVLLNALTSRAPRYQHMSTVATMKLLERAKSETVRPVKTWAYHLKDHPEAVCDQNYFVVQEMLPEEYKQFSTLDVTEKPTVLKGLDLKELYRVLKYANLWNPSEENLWVNSDKQSELAYPDGEKPNNEGVGEKAFRKITIFGQDLGKAKFNIRNEWDGGHRGFENILKAHCNDRVEEWMSYWENDEEMK